MISPQKQLSGTYGRGPVDFALWSKASSVILGVNWILYYHVFPEAKENGQQRKRLDILVRDGSHPAYGFELLFEANKPVFNDHSQKSAYYGEPYHCSMHFTSSGKPRDYFGPGDKDVMVILYIVYKKAKAELVYIDGVKTVDIKGAGWQVMFDSKTD